jgi:hypothetical protein
MIKVFAVITGFAVALALVLLVLWGYVLFGDVSLVSRCGERPAL